MSTSTTGRRDTVAAAPRHGLHRHSRRVRALAAALLTAGALAGVGVPATGAAAAPQHGHHHASTCTRELRHTAAVMSRLTHHHVTCAEAAVLLRKGK